ncbi:alpha-D-ribose 1-methylphosphonate 5-triphosphate diphosphatase [Phyllobacterium salinisoli]|uniref:Alpha-D-ribose 1-methylphosphonate 5-triphosphate diphosphatase n=1 Tax=Phyllobacterium salinisoli TaxID=1899321 RepID=A0A368K807_9HYPH|nr:alpha-D-ribose 1-methylphosphonate 5-triphosphate diphosphatase [Phyllobacterium salinisoli]RCS25351.1 alpha-D-ribose 1-methylphosphonate 5-triphosphate diphosphatase [Phyllobacterium salinisoli]
MPHEFILKNARIILDNEVLAGSVLVRDGEIADISEGSTAAGEDMEGDFLTPGLIELHTDHLEGHYAPRPKVRWNPIAAVQAHDAQIAASGITTVFDALRVGLDDEAEVGVEDMRVLADAISDGMKSNRLRAEHFLHLRCEVSAPDCLEAFSLLEGYDRVRMASLMDHAPGQRQFTDPETYRVYYMRKMKVSEEEFRLYCERRMAQSQRNSAANRAAISQACRARDIVLASHDDATVAHVGEAVEQGIRVAEFPTTLTAAEASKQAGLSVLMGAPNVVRGGSHSGNVSARELAENGCLDILSSDYIPFSLMQSAFFLSDVVDRISLPQAMRLVSKNSAEAVGLDDRGEIAVGKRADLVRVRVDDHVPLIKTVWRQGARVI